jgi:hypothetical protein
MENILLHHTIPFASLRLCENNPLLTFLRQASLCVLPAVAGLCEITIKPSRSLET